MAEQGKKKEELRVEEAPRAVEFKHDMSQMQPMSAPQMQPMAFAQPAFPTMPQKPMVCCPFLMNMQCPMLLTCGFGFPFGGMTTAMPTQFGTEQCMTTPYMYSFPMMGMQR